VPLETKLRSNTCNSQHPYIKGVAYITGLINIRVQTTCCDKEFSNISSKLVQKDSKLSNVEEYIVFAGVCNVWCEVLADDTVPVGWIFLVKERLDKLRDFFFGLFL